MWMMCIGTLIMALWTYNDLIGRRFSKHCVHPDYARRAEEAYKAATDVQLHMIKGGAHRFSKKHDVLAMGYLRDFARR